MTIKETPETTKEITETIKETPKKDPVVEVKDREGHTFLKLEGINAERTLALRKKLQEAGQKNTSGVYVMVENPAWEEHWERPKVKKLVKEIQINGHTIWKGRE